MSDLVKYDAACRALADAVSIDEVKAFRDQSEAMRAYARQAKNKQLEAQAAEIRFRAERRIGELMAAQRDGGHLNRGAAATGIGKRGSEGNPHSAVAAPTLEEVGIDKKLADRARKYAAIPEEEFNGIMDDWKQRIEGENARVSVDLLAAGKKAQAKAAGKDEGAQESARTEDVPDPFGHRKLTYEALADTADGLRAALAEQKANTAAQRAEIDMLKACIKEFEGQDMGRALGNAQRRATAAEGRMKEYQAQALRAERRAKMQEAEIKKLRAEIENQVIPL